MRNSSALFALCALLGLACDNPKKTETGAEPTPVTAAQTTVPDAGSPADAPIELPKLDGPVAKVNGVEIAPEAFLKELKATLERYQRASHQVAPALRERLKDNIVRRLVDAELVAQEAKKAGVSVAEDEFQKEWTEHKKRYGSEDSFQSFLTRSGMAVEDLQNQYRHNLLREKLFAKLTEKLEVTEAERKAFYEQNKDRYNNPEQIRASHILLRVKPDATPEDKAAVRAKAEDIVKQAKAKGADFIALATEFGEDPTKDRGGDLGFFGKGRMVKPFEDAVFALKDNEISGVVETSFGFHIIKRTGYKAASTQTYKELKEQIDRSVRSRKRNEAIRDSLKAWRETAQIEILLKGDPKLIESGGGRPQGMRGPDGAALPMKMLPKPSTVDRPARLNPGVIPPRPEGSAQ